MPEELQHKLEARLASPKLTPMMKQYLTVKLEHPTALVFFRMGDFFETFFEDAEECAKRLDITLTARSKERDIPMAGVPHHALDSYLGRLIEQQCTVVLVDQVENPKQAKGLVRREVTRIVTPGTYIDPHVSGRQQNYLVAIELDQKKRKTFSWALAALDLSTGDFRATSGFELDGLIDEVSRLGAREIIYLRDVGAESVWESLKNARPDLLLSSLESTDYASSACLKQLREHFGEDEFLALSLLLPEVSLVASGRALAYARLTQVREAPDLSSPAGLGHILHLQPYIPGDALVLDREACSHLELFVSSNGGRRGSLLGAIDQTVTPMGGRRLADRLAYPTKDLVEVRSRQEAVEALRAAPSLLDELRLSLRAVADADRLVGRIILGRALPRDLVQLMTSLRAAPEVFAVAYELKNARLQSIAKVDPCTDVVELLEKALLEEPSNTPSSGPIFRAGFDTELDRYTEISTKGKALIEELEERERTSTRIPSLKIKFNKVFGYFIEVTKANLSLVPERFVRKQTTVNAERYFTDELKDLEDEVLHAEERRVNRTEERLTELLQTIGTHVARLKALSAAFAELDILQGFAFLARSGDWVVPELHDGVDIDISEGRHPVLDLLVATLGERFVPNDMLISDEQRLLIITGPNMAGKSTIMRQTALITILAYVGCPVPAKKARIGRVDRIFTRVGASDDLSRGRSTFMVEMTEASRILRSATQYDLILLDEIGRGTSTFDGLAIAWAIAEYIHDHVKARTLFATHYHELTELAQHRTGVINHHVAVFEQKNEIVFLRKLQPGATNRSYGVQVANLAGLPSDVVSRARKLLSQLESSRQTHPQMQLDFASTPSEDPEIQKISETEREVVAKLKRLDINDLSPRQALNLLGDLQDTLL